MNKILLGDSKELLKIVGSESVHLTCTSPPYYNAREYSTWPTYQEYLDTLQPKERQLKLKAERYNTFLVFHSGKCIMSGLVSDFMRDTYDYFLNIIRKAYDSIEERLD